MTFSINGILWPSHPVCMYVLLQDITALFASDKCPNYSSCEFADNDCWYITFDSEEDTQKVWLYINLLVFESVSFLFCVHASLVGGGGWLLHPDIKGDVLISVLLFDSTWCVVHDSFHSERPFISVSGKITMLVLYSFEGIGQWSFDSTFHYHTQEVHNCIVNNIV